MIHAADYLRYFDQYLDQLANDLRSYPAEDTLWLQPPGINNSAGNLALHLLGNLNHFIGAALGDTGYIRERDLEFGRKGVPRAEVLTWLEQTKSMIHQTLQGLDTLDAPYPSGYFPTEETLVHQLNRLLAHLAYHTGQVNYHRRLLAPDTV